METGHTRQTIETLTKYMEYCQSTSSEDISIEGFYEDADIETSNFYQTYDSLLDIEADIWDYMMRDAIHTVLSDEQFVRFETKEQLLSLLYTFFENLTLNRSYFVVHLGRRYTFKEKRVVYKKMKEIFQQFISEHISRSSLSTLGIDQVEIISTYWDKGQKEAFWIQVVCLIEFWRKDQSEAQEKTDIAIEKSVKAAMDLIEVAPIKSLMDLGKFLWQERKTLG